jgi:hypothetical protein
MKTNQILFKKILLKENKKKIKSLKIKIKKRKSISSFFFNSNKYDIIYLRKLYLKVSYDFLSLKNFSSFFGFFFDINFLKKEKIYTKLKYSRVPQYDTVSGASAALLAGFLGFLICEKFGFELLDSGDFYFLFMYLVFVSFALRLFVKLFSLKSNN